MIFTKYRSCLTGPTGELTLITPTVDWEIELVTVIGRIAHQVTPEEALDHVAGYTIGQDISG